MTIHRLPEAAQRAAWDRLWFALLSRPSDDERDDANDDERPTPLHRPVLLRRDDEQIA